MLTSSEQEWLRVRSYLREHRYNLAVDAATAYPADAKVADTPLLAASAWIPATPIPLHDIGLDLMSDGGDQLALGEYATDGLPERADGSRYRRYSEVVGDLAAPSIFENRTTYRLTKADLRSAGPNLTFGHGRYFDGIDVGEAAAHRYASIRLDGGPAEVRAAMADPCDLSRRPANLGITTMTVRHDRARDTASFPLHWRDPAKVGHAGGLYQVIPVGIFQPSGEAPHNEHNDFSLWRSMIREFAEELSGHSEEYGSETRPIEYPAWPFAQRLNRAIDDGQLKVWCLGLGVDPLTYATDLLTVAVFDSTLFDDLFGTPPQNNAEGQLLPPQQFDHATVTHLTTREPMQAAGAATLHLAWHHRDYLLT
jgi:hypothetical protein